MNGFLLVAIISQPPSHPFRGRNKEQKGVMANARALAFAVSVLLVVFCPVCNAKIWKYEPTWESLDQHKGPSWFDNAKIGVFVHWGVYSVPSFGVNGVLGEWFWWALRGKYLMRSFFTPNIIFTIKIQAFCQQ